MSKEWGPPHHALVFDPITKTGLHRRWDDALFQEQCGFASDRDARAFIRKIESVGQPPTGEGVVSRTLATFVLLRAAIEQRHGTESDVAVAFNIALLLAEKWRDSFAKMPSIGLADALARFTTGHPWLAVSSVGPQVQDYDIGEFVKIMLEDKQNGSPYLLDADLLIRHASGQLYQELHKKLLIPAPPIRQPSLYSDSLPTGPIVVRRLRPPESVAYTPPWLARALVEIAFSNADWDHKGGLDVLDPACGSGVFLIEAARELEQSSERAICLRGMDVSPEAAIMSSFCIGETSREL